MTNSLVTTQPAILLIWEEAPEGLKFFIIPESEISSRQLDLIKEANGKMVNRDDLCEGLLFLNNVLNSPDAKGFDIDSSTGCFTRYLVEWVMRRDDETPIDLSNVTCPNGYHITKTFQSGFVM